MKDLFGEELAQTIISGAEFSPDRKYRYALWRIWDQSRPLVILHRRHTRRRRLKLYARQDRLRRLLPN